MVNEVWSQSIAGRPWAGRAEPCWLMNSAAVTLARAEAKGPAVVARTTSFLTDQSRPVTGPVAKGKKAVGVASPAWAALGVPLHSAVRLRGEPASRQRWARSGVARAWRTDRPTTTSSSAERPGILASTSSSAATCVAYAPRLDSDMPRLSSPTNPTDPRRTTGAILSPWTTVPSLPTRAAPQGLYCPRGRQSLPRHADRHVSPSRAGLDYPTRFRPRRSDRPSPSGPVRHTAPIRTQPQPPVRPVG